jgi:uncharacterized protein YfaP (DUF2135 family)
MKKSILYGLLTIGLMWVMTGCGGGGTTAAASRKVSGKVSNYTTGAGAAGLEVQVGGKTVTTGADGTYEIDASSGRVLVNVRGAGYAATSKSVTVGTASNARATLDIDILPVAFSGTFDPAADFIAQVPGSPGRVAISAGSLVLAGGAAPAGDITGELTPIDPSLEIGLMPGDMIDNNGDSIASYGAMTVEFKDASGNALNLAAGESATIWIPVSTRGTVPPARIPLYYYDKAQGVWVAEGTAELSGDKTQYKGTVGHFSTWNADYLYDSVTVKGCVQDANTTARIAGATVEMIGQNYNGANAAMTDSDGNFEISVMQSAFSLITASKGTKVSNTVEVDVGVSEVTLDDCLFLGNAPLTVRLTWGEHPHDLDTHVIGPSAYHIWYGYYGSYAVESAHLDVDDVTSYGPEVFTALRFPEAGTYHYAVYHFSGSSTITASPARVELMLNGEKTIFTPPAGQGASDTWWNVFDIIVDDAGNMRIVTINTWATDAVGPTQQHRRARMFMPAKK